MAEEVGGAAPAPKVTVDNFVGLCVRTESCDFAEISKRLLTPQMIRLLHAGMGMCTESGEFVDQIKRAIFYGSPLDTGNLLEEVGDQLWYMSIALSELDADLSEAMSKVIEKLRRRYPEKYSDDSALNRDLASEKELF